MIYNIFFFFFQAEDGIRDLTVTGVQTCALPISVASESADVVRARQRSARLCRPRRGTSAARRPERFLRRRPTHRPAAPPAIREDPQARPLVVRPAPGSRPLSSSACAE